MKLDGNNGAHWDTDPTTESWTLGVARTVQEPLLNQPDGSLSFMVTDGGRFVVIASDTDPQRLVNPANLYTLTLIWSDGPTPAVVATSRGDVNADQRVNILNATLSLRFAVGLLPPTVKQKTLGDLNDDGKLNLQDTTAILQKAVAS